VYIFTTGFPIGEYIFTIGEFFTAGEYISPTGAYIFTIGDYTFITGAQYALTTGALLQVR